MSASLFGPVIPALGWPTRPSAAQIDGVSIYLGPCRERSLVMHAQLAALSDEEDDETFDVAV